MRSRRGQAGTALVESAILLPVFVLIICGGLAVLYLSFARVWIERTVYETAVCLASLAKTPACEREFRLKTSQALPIGKISRLQLSQSSRYAIVTVRFAVQGQDVIHLRQRLALPLSSNQARGGWR